MGAGLASDFVKAMHISGSVPPGSQSQYLSLVLKASVAHAALTQAPGATLAYSPEDQQEPEGNRVCGQDTAELFHFFKQSQAQAASVSDEVGAALAARAQKI